MNGRTYDLSHTQEDTKASKTVLCCEAASQAQSLAVTHREQTHLLELGGKWPLQSPTALSQASGHHSWRLLKDFLCPPGLS